MKDHDNLIFIISQPRSGSTLLQNILSNNRQVNTSSESWILLALTPYFRPDLISATFDFQKTYEAYQDYESKFSLDGMDTKAAKIALELYEPLMKNFDYVIDKTPRYWEIMYDIKRIFPNSKIIILKRDPIDVVKSIINTWEIYTLEKLNYFRRDLLDAPVELNLFCHKNKNDSNVYVLKYEDLVSDMGLEVKRLYLWLGLDYNKNVLDFQLNKKHLGKFGDPYQNNLRKNPKAMPKIMHDFIEGYKDYLNSKNIKEYGYHWDSNTGKSMEFRYFQNLGTYSTLRMSTRFRSELSLYLKGLYLKFLK